MISKTKVYKRMKRKTNPDLAEAIILAKKKNLVELAGALSAPTRKQAKVNLYRINETKGSSIIVPGKVLSGGYVKRKLKVYALDFSKAAREKLENAGCETEKIISALRKGTEVTGEILK